MWQWRFLYLSYIWWGIADNGAQKVWHQCKISASCGRQPAEKLTSKATKMQSNKAAAAYKDIRHDAKHVFYGFAPNWAKNMCFLCSARYMAPTRGKVREWSNPSKMLTLRRSVKKVNAALWLFFLSKELGVDHMMNDGTEEEQKVRAEMTRGFKVNICSSRLFRKF